MNAVELLIAVRASTPLDVLEYVQSGSTIATVVDTELTTCADDDWDIAGCFGFTITQRTVLSA